MAKSAYKKKGRPNTLPKMQCDLCHKPIAIGEIAVVMQGVGIRRCMACAEHRNRIDDAGKIAVGGGRAGKMSGASGRIILDPRGLS